MVGTPKAARNQTQTGLRRVSWVGITLDTDGAHCHVHGIGHRLPATRPVSLDTALALAADGVPTVVRSADGVTEPLLPTA